MATPISDQAANKLTGPCAAASAHNPAANTKLLPASTFRPPYRSTNLPAKGPSSADTTSAAEKARNTVETSKPKLCAMPLARTAGK